MNNHFASPRVAAVTIALLSAASLWQSCVADEDMPDADPSITSTANVQLETPTNSEQGVLTADNVTYENGLISAEGTSEKPVVYRSGPVTVTAQKVLLDTNAQTLTAIGTVHVTRQVSSTRQLLSPGRLRERYQNELQTETLSGDHFFYDYGKQEGRLDNVEIVLANFNISASQLIVNGQIYTARDVIIRPGGLSDGELKIYGTPPLSLHARLMTIDNSKTAPTDATDKAQNASLSHQPSLTAQGAGLYFHNTKIFPVPTYVLRSAILGGNREKKAFNIVPRISTGSVDGLMVTAQLQYALNRDNPEALQAVADIGLSLRQGFRGGIGLDARNKFGSFNVNAHINDIITNQIDNRIRLNRMPEFNYTAPRFSLFNLPGDRQAGLILGASWGKYRETNIDNENHVNAGRTQLYAKFTTRLKNPRGPYLEVFARGARYSNFDQNMNTLGYEIGYYDSITKYIDGQFSYSHTSVSGATPFSFDRVEIRSELRATFDILLTPRYIIPIDLRYDLDRHEFRDKTYGILRNYKSFAYGLTYNTAHRELRLEFRQGF